MKPLAVFDDQVDVRTCEAIYGRMVTAVVPHSTFGVGAAMLADPEQLTSDLCAYFDGMVARFLPRHLARVLGVSGVTEPGAVIEFWTRVLPVGGRAEYLHRDLDETRLNRTGEHASPVVSSVLHLTPFGMEGGATWVVARADESEAVEGLVDGFVDVEALTQQCPSSIRLPAATGRLVVFDGGLAHIVERVRRAPGPRLTLLANVFRPGGTDTFPVPSSVANLDPENYSILTSLGHRAFGRLRKTVALSGVSQVGELVKDPDYSVVTARQLTQLAEAMMQMPTLPG